MSLNISEGTSQDLFSVCKSDFNQLKTMNVYQPELNKQDQYGRTILHLACLKNHTDAIKYLIELGSDPNITDNFNLTPVHWCVYFGNFTIIQLLIEKKFKIIVKDEDSTHDEEIDLSLLNDDKKVFKFLLVKLTDQVMKYIAQATLFHRAAYLGDYRTICKLLLDEELAIDARVEKNTSVLHLAAFKGHIRIVELLLNKSANLLELMDNCDRSALHWAAICGNVDVIERLLPTEIIDDYLGQKINSADVNNNTPLYLATVYGNNDAIKYLLYQDAELKLESGENYIHLNCTSTNELDIILNEFMKTSRDNSLAILNWGIAFCSQETVKKYFRISHTSTGVFDKKNSALHTAAAFNREDVLQIFFKNKMGINAFMTSGYIPPITWAVYNGHKRILKYMIENGCIFKKIQLNDNYFRKYPYYLYLDGQWKVAPIPLHSAAIKGDLDAVKILLDAGENINASWISRAIDFAVLNGHRHLVKYLLENGAETEGLMHNVAAKGDVNQLKMLVDLGLSVDAKHGRAPLFEACASGKFDNVKFLVENGANVNDIATSPYKIEALHQAIRSNSVEIVEYLLKNGANVNFNDTSGLFPKTPLSEAMLFSRIYPLKYEIFRLLIIYGANLHADINLFRAYVARSIVRPTSIDNDIVKLLHLAGLRFDKINLVPDEESIPKIFTDIPDGLRQYYMQVRGKPLTLRQLSRIALRESCGRRYMEMIEGHHLPSSIRDYLLFKIVNNEI